MQPVAWLSRLRSAIGALTHRRDWERDLDAELAAHVEHRAADLERSGVPPAAAARQARLELGAAERWKESCRHVQGLRWPDQLRQDLHYAARGLRRSPAFAVFAMLSLALGIGANTVVFSVVNALLLRPLDVVSPASVFTVTPRHSFPNYLALRDRNTTFSGLAAYRIAPMGLETTDGTRRVWGYLVTGNYFDLLGIRPLRGTFFHADADRRQGASPYAVISYSCWRDRFAGDSSIVGRTVRINGLAYTVLGVAPPAFHGTELFYWPEIWVPVMMQPQIEGTSWLDSPNSFNCSIIGRLAPGVGTPQAAANLRALAAALARERPQANEHLVLGLAQPGLLGDSLRAPTRAFAGGIMLLALLVLLAACANLANLLAARTSDRHRELAVRLSIGAGRGRILRQLLVESALLSLAGGAAGYGLAAVLLRLLSRWHAPLDFPVQFEVNPDWRVLLFAFAASLVTGLLSGIAPASQALRADPNDTLKGAPAGLARFGARRRRPAPGAVVAASRAGRRLWAARDLLLGMQVVVCCLLLTACLVALRGLSRTLAAPLGLAPAGLAVVGFDLGLAGHGAAQAEDFERRALAAALRLPGVTAAAWGNSLPLSIDQSTTTVFPEGSIDLRPSNGTIANHYEVAPGYLATLGTRLLAGRDFNWHDDARAPQVAIVNLTFARRLLGIDATIARAGAAVGRRFIGFRRDSIEIVGVVEDGKYVSLTEDPTAAIFRPILQQPNTTAVLLARTRFPAAAMAQELRRAVAGLDPSLPLYGTGSLVQMLGLAMLPARAASIALGAFGLLAVMLAVTGIYGLTSYTVSRRKREIGIRMAVGARHGQLLRFLLGRTALLLGAGSIAGLALAAAADRILASVVPFASSRDPLILLAAVVTMTAIGCAAAFEPARRALHVDPVDALRRE